MTNADAPEKFNIFDTRNAPVTGERFETLFRCRNVHIERIVSSSQPDPVVYAQP